MRLRGPYPGAGSPHMGSPVFASVPSPGPGPGQLHQHRYRMEPTLPFVCRLPLVQQNDVPALTPVPRPVSEWATPEAVDLQR